MRFDLVKKAVKYAKKLAYAKNKAISFYLVTNLIALNDEISNFLKKENFFWSFLLMGKKNYTIFIKIA